jgi:DNA-binding MarR family transcriptional regulator
MAEQEAQNFGEDSLFSLENLLDPQSLSGCSASDLRNVALLLTSLADALEEKAPAERREQISHLLTTHPPDRELARVAERLYRFREARSQFLPDLLLGEPAWDILLDLFYQETVGREVVTTDALIAARVPATTALRYLGQLELEGLIRREKARGDQRKRNVTLTVRGKSAMKAYISSLLNLEKSEDAVASNSFLLRS